MIKEFIIYTCPMCGGPSHPATGYVYTPTFIICWRCTEEVWIWLRNYINGRRNNKGLFFYDYVNMPR